jgi:DMSO/TMAO reductase YedYZ heme-binding membrane subunit
MLLDGGFIEMNHKLNHALQTSVATLQQFWKDVYPYLVISRIALLVCLSLAFLHFDQTLKRLLVAKPFKLQNLRYVNRLN